MKFEVEEETKENEEVGAEGEDDEAYTGILNRAVNRYKPSTKIY